MRRTLRFRSSRSSARQASELAESGNWHRRSKARLSSRGGRSQRICRLHQLRTAQQNLNCRTGRSDEKPPTEGSPLVPGSRLPPADSHRLSRRSRCAGLRDQCQRSRSLLNRRSWTDSPRNRRSTVPPEGPSGGPGAPKGGSITTPPLRDGSSSHLPEGRLTFPALT